MIYDSCAKGGHILFPGFGIILQILIFVGFIGIIYWVLKAGKINNKINDNPKNILKNRLANGEIKLKEYKELLKEITKNEKIN